LGPSWINDNENFFARFSVVSSPVVIGQHPLQVASAPVTPESQPEIQQSPEVAQVQSAYTTTETSNNQQEAVQPRVQLPKSGLCVSCLSNSAFL